MSRKKAKLEDLLIPVFIVLGILVLVVQYYYVVLPILIVLIYIVFLTKSSNKNKTRKILPFVPDRFVVVDIQTTGLNIIEDEIIEIGAIKADPKTTNQISFHALVKPIQKITSRSVSYNGITQEMVDKDGETLKEAISGFLDFIEDLPLVAYKAAFDMRFLKKAAKKYGFLIDNDISCAYKMTKRAFPKLKSYRLCDVAKEFGLSSGNYQHAIANCIITINVYSITATKLHAYR